MSSGDDEVHKVHAPDALSEKVNDDTDGGTLATPACGCGTFTELLLSGVHTDHTIMRLTFMTETKHKCTW